MDKSKDPVYQSYKQRYPDTEYTEKEFTISNKELMRIVGLDSIAQAGKVAESLITSYFNTTIIPRIGEKNSEDVGLLYDLEQGTLKLFSPKVWCETCGAKKGFLEFDGKKLCKNCFVSASIQKPATSEAVETLKEPVTPTPEQKPQ